MLVPLTADPRLAQVDTDIFRLRYFGACMQCTFCHDSCCQYGADVNLPERDRILAEADSLSKRVKFPREQWFSSEVSYDPEYPGGAFVRTQKVEGACVFLNREGRGCLLHAWAMEKGRDYHSIKPMVCWMFPVIWDQKVLRPSMDVTDGLVCVDQGQTLYDSARGELEVVFGPVVIQELDNLRG